MSRKSGFAAETLALEYLLAQGLELVTRNYQVPCGEIDLILQDQETLVFVEVRKRSQQDFGSGAESIGTQKTRHLLSAARYYLLETEQYDKVPVRLDVIDISLQENGNHVEWLRNAIWEKW